MAPGRPGRPADPHLDRRTKNARTAAPAPPWTLVFADDSAPAPATFGRGRTLSVYWGTGAEATPVPIALPTASSGDYWPDEDTPLIGEGELLQAQASALRSVETDAGVTFEMVEFTLPDREKPTRAFWREHLDHLQRRGEIAAFGTRPNVRKLAVLTADRRSAAIIENVVLLDRDDMMIRDCTPMRQEPVRGSSTRPGRVRYPDYPLRSDYLGLVETDDGRRVVDLLKQGERVGAKPPSVDEGPHRQATGHGRSATSSSNWLKEGSEQAARAARNLVSAGQRVADGIGSAVRDGEDLVSTGRRVVDTLWRGEPAREGSARADETRRPSAKATWELRLAGRSDLLPITLPVPDVDAADDEDRHHRAHWMVWPRFRSKSKEKPYWRAYYVYEHCTDARLCLSTLWLDPDDDCVRRRRPERAGAHPVSFHAGDQREHTGGPPVAFSLENRESGQELGLYVLNLEPLGRRQADVKVGLDFGTSHTVAAVQLDGKKHLVELAPELDPARNDPIVLHVSENWSHVTDICRGIEEARRVAADLYGRPRPEGKARGCCRRKLLTIRAAGEPERDDDPSRMAARPRLRDSVHGHAAERLGRLPPCRLQVAGRRLRHFGTTNPCCARSIWAWALELVMADVVWRRLRALAVAGRLDLHVPAAGLVRAGTGLRAHAAARDGRQRQKLRGRLQTRPTTSGSTTNRAPPRAARACSARSAWWATSAAERSTCSSRPKAGPGVDFEEVADSAKLGGNELLRKMAEHADRFLPPGWASRSDDHADPTARLDALQGGQRGSSATAPGRPSAMPAWVWRVSPSLGAAGAARALIERYFLLIVEYMARSLVAYLVRHWYSRVLEHCPDHHERLRVLVQLRGNGWASVARQRELRRDRTEGRPGRRRAGPASCGRIALGRPRCMARSGRPVAEARPVDWKAEGGRQGRAGRRRA